MFSGRNTDNNKVSVVNVDDNGRIKIDESGKITDIETQLDTINSQGVKSNLSYLRSQGKCFTVGGTGVTGTASTDFYMLSLFNPAGSGKTVYVYAGDFSLNGSGLTAGYFQLQIKKLTTATTGGVAKVAHNLKLGQSSATIQLIQNGSVTSTDNIYSSRQVNSNDSGDVDFHQNIILFNEMVEIPEGYGLALNGYRSASNNVYYYYNLRFVEV